MDYQIKSIDGLPELAERGWMIYNTRLKQELESKYKGKLVAIEVEALLGCGLLKGQKLEIGFASRTLKIIPEA